MNTKEAFHANNSRNASFYKMIIRKTEYQATIVFKLPLLDKRGYLQGGGVRKVTVDKTRIGPMVKINRIIIF